MGTPKGTVFRIGRNRSHGDQWSDTWWAAAAGVLPAAAALASRMRAIDLAYHVRAGQLAIRSGDVVRTDPFTFTTGGRPWLNQQWGAQLVFASAHRLAGWAGVAVAYAGALGAGFALLYRSCRRSGADVRAAGILTVLGFVVGASSLGARPQALAVPLFTGTWLLLSRRDRWIWLVPIVAVIWASVHGSFVLAPVLCALALADDVVRREPLRRSALVLLATIAATWITPFGPRVWSYAWEIATDDTIRSTVAEWRPPSPLTGAGAVFWLSGLAVVWIGGSRRSVVGVVDLARLLLFFVLGALALRSTVWWALAAPPVVAGWLPRAESATEIRSLRGADARRAAPVVLVSVAVLVGAFSLRLGIDPVTGAPQRLRADAPEVLVGATRRALPAGSRLLVFQPFASWFEYSLPDRPVMVDTRIELYSDDVWDDYDTVIVAADRWRDVALGWRVAGIVLPPGAVLADDLRDDADWRRVTESPAGSVFVRR